MALINSKITGGFEITGGAGTLGSAASDITDIGVNITGSTLTAPNSNTIGGLNGDFISGQAGSDYNPTYATTSSTGLLISGSTISDTATSNYVSGLNLQGYSGNVTGKNGVSVDIASSTISTNADNVTIGFNPTYSTVVTQTDGIHLDGGDTIKSTGTGNIVLEGVSSPASGTLVPTGITSSGTSTNHVTTASGNITFAADSLNLAELNATTTSGTFIFAPYTLSTSIGINGAPGSLNISKTDLGFVHAPSITVGTTSDTGLLTDAYHGWNSGVTLLNGSGNIVLTGQIITPANDSITIADISGKFINQAGQHALAPGAGGRFLIYTTDASHDTLDGLATDFQISGCPYGQTCTSLPATGNGLVFSSN